MQPLKWVTSFWRKSGREPKRSLVYHQDPNRLPILDYWDDDVSKLLIEPVDNLTEAEIRELEDAKLRLKIWEKEQLDKGEIDSWVNDQAYMQMLSVQYHWIEKKAFWWCSWWDAFNDKEKQDAREAFMNLGVRFRDRPNYDQIVAENKIRKRKIEKLEEKLYPKQKKSNHMDNVVKLRKILKMDIDPMKTTLGIWVSLVKSAEGE